MHWYRRLIQVKASKSVHKSVKYAADLGWLEWREHLHGATCLTHFSKITQSCSFARAVFSYQCKRLTHQLAWLWDSWGREKKIECEGLASVKGWRAVEGSSRLDKAPRISIRVVTSAFLSSVNHIFKNREPAMLSNQDISQPYILPGSLVKGMELLVLAL